MWGALGVISALIGFGALIGVVVGLIKGAIGKGWGLLVNSTVIFIVSYVLLVFAVEREFSLWSLLHLISYLIMVAAFVGTIVGLIKGVVGKGWRLLSYSSASFIVCLVLFAFTEAKVNPNETESPSVSDNISATVSSLPAAPAPTRASNASDDLNDCKNRFRSRKSAVMSLHNNGLLDAYGLSDIGVLNKYGISIDAAVAVSDILYANGLYGLQNHYDEVAHAICAEVRHDERLIRDGTREAFVNR